MIEDTNRATVRMLQCWLYWGVKCKSKTAHVDRWDEVVAAFEACTLPTEEELEKLPNPLWARHKAR